MVVKSRTADPGTRGLFFSNVTSYSGSTLVSRCSGLFSLLCLGFCTFRCTSALLFRRALIDSCLVSRPPFFYSLSLVSFLGSRHFHQCVCVSLPSLSLLYPSASSSCLGASSSTPPLSRGTAAGPAPAAPGTCPSGNKGAGQRWCSCVWNLTAPFRSRQENKRVWQNLSKVIPPTDIC